MKMLRVLSVAVFLLCSGCSGGKDETDWEREELKGRVKSVKEISFNVKERFGEIVKEEKSMGSELFFNENGNKIEGNRYYSDGSFRREFIYEYDGKGNKIEEVDGRLDVKRIYKYNKGKVIEINIYALDSSWKSRTIPKYDDKGNKIESITYRNGVLMRKIAYKYDERCNKVEEVSYEYDFGGDIVWYYRYVYKYDNRDNKVEESHYDLDGGLYIKYVDEYDDKGRIGAYCYDSDGRLKWRVAYKYDANGNTIESNSYNSDRGSLMIRNTYEYDNKGNWIKQIKFRNEIPMSITEREITYY